VGETKLPQRGKRVADANRFRLSVGQLIDNQPRRWYTLGQVIDERSGGEMSGESAVEQAGGGGNRRALVLAAYARIARDGFEGLRTRDVAADVGVNIGTLHYYFPSKETLIRAAAERMTERFVAALPEEGSPAEQLREHLERLRHLLKTDQELWAVASEVALRAARDEVIADIVRQGDDQWFPFLRGLVARGVEDGTLDHSLQPESVAATLIAAVRGLSLPWPGAFRPEQIDQTFDQLERWLGLSSTTSPEPRES
jgi:AcrR family transcriptional regulator